MQKSLEIAWKITVLRSTKTRYFFKISIWILLYIYTCQGSFTFIPFFLIRNFSLIFFGLRYQGHLKHVCLIWWVSKPKMSCPWKYYFCLIWGLRKRLWEVGSMLRLQSAPPSVCALGPSHCKWLDTIQMKSSLCLDGAALDGIVGYKSRAGRTK